MGSAPRCSAPRPPRQTRGAGGCLWRAPHGARLSARWRRPSPGGRGGRGADPSGRHPTKNKHGLEMAATGPNLGRGQGLTPRPEVAEEPLLLSCAGALTPPHSRPPIVGLSFALKGPPLVGSTGSMPTPPAMASERGQGHLRPMGWGREGAWFRSVKDGSHGGVTGIPSAPLQIPVPQATPPPPGYHTALLADKGGVQVRRKVRHGEGGCWNPPRGSPALGSPPPRPGARPLPLPDSS